MGWLTFEVVFYGLHFLCYRVVVAPVEGIHEDAFAGQGPPSFSDDGVEVLKDSFESEPLDGSWSGFWDVGVGVALLLVGGPPGHFCVRRASWDTDGEAGAGDGGGGFPSLVGFRWWQGRGLTRLVELVHEFVSVDGRPQGRGGAG